MLEGYFLVKLHYNAVLVVAKNGRAKALNPPAAGRDAEKRFEEGGEDSRSENVSYTRSEVQDPGVEVRRRISFTTTNLNGSFQDDGQDPESNAAAQ
jgi:hypothetical protein